MSDRVVIVACSWKRPAILRERDIMTGSVIIAGARTPMGRLLGSLKGFSAAQLGGIAIKGALERAGVPAGPGGVRDHGPRHPGRCRADHRPAGRGRGRHRDGRAGAHRSTRCVCPASTPIALADQLIRAGEFEHRRRRRHGVDDQRTAPAGREPRGRQVRRLVTMIDSMAHDAPVLRVRPDVPWGSPPRTYNARYALTRAGAGRVRRPLAPAGRARAEGRSVRRRDRPGRRSEQRRGEPIDVPTPTRAFAPTPPSSPWPACARRSARTAPSPPARPRRSPTAPPPWS